MAIQNMPFAKNGEEYRKRDIEEERMSLEDAKKMFPVVSQINFKNACIEKKVPHYLHDLYYMHYLAILGDYNRIRNFKQDLDHRDIDVIKLVNYNMDRRFNYGSVLHTFASWNDDAMGMAFLINECGGDMSVQDRNALFVFEYQEQEDVYDNPFIDILGHGELPFNQFDIRRRNPNDFRRIANYVDEFDPINVGRNEDVDPYARAHGHPDGFRQEEEEEEEEINVIEPEPMLQRQNAVLFDAINNQRQEPGGVRRNLFPILGQVPPIEPVVNAALDYIPLPIEPESEEEESDIEIVMDGDEIHVNMGMGMDIDEEPEPEPEHANANGEQSVILNNRLNEKYNDKFKDIDQDLKDAVQRIFKDDNIAQNNMADFQVLTVLQQLRITTYDDFIETKLHTGDLEEAGIEDERILDQVWDFIELHSPNFVFGEWIN